MSELFQEICKLLQVKRTNLTSFNLQMQEKVEKFHMGLNQSMSHYVKKYGDDWDEFVNYALMAHRAVPHSTTRYSPFYLLYGREMRLPAEDDLMLKKFVTNDGASSQDSVQHHLETLADRLKEAYLVASENNKMGRERQKEYYNRGTKLVTFQPGDMVYLKEMMNSRKKCAKFRIRWKGPYEVIRRLSDLNYLVKLSRTKEIVVNMNKMNCFRQTALRPTTEPRRRQNRAQDKLDTLETYGTSYSRPDSQTPLSDATREDTTETLTQDPDFEPYHHARTRASNCEATKVQEGGGESPTLPKGKPAGEYNRDLYDSSQVSEGEGGTMSEPLCTEQVEPESTPNEPLRVRMLLTRVRRQGVRLGTTCDPVPEETFRLLI